jgi:isovaleryl-CoA dehydrogenase
MSTFKDYDLFTPTEQHAQLRSMVRSFCETEVIPQAIEWNRKEEFNVKLFRKLGELGLLGITVAEEFGGSGIL